jgi:hypothetical protein
MTKHQAQPYVQAERFARGRGIRIFQTRRLPNECPASARRCRNAALVEASGAGDANRLGMSVRSLEMPGIRCVDFPVDQAGVPAEVGGRFRTPRPLQIGRRGADDEVGRSQPSCPLSKRETRGAGLGDISCDVMG